MGFEALIRVITDQKLGFKDQQNVELLILPA